MFDVKTVQTKLAAAGHSVGAIDGDLGPATYGAILDYVVGHTVGNATVMVGRAMAADFPKYQITTPLRMAHWIGQGATETQGFTHMSEYGSGKDANHDGYDDYLEQYDFRKDLGNGHVGDGDKYRGRGIFMITGIFNYTLYGTRIGVNLLANPQRAAEPEIATLTACLFWTDRKINVLADADDCAGVTKKINGGTNALSQRQAYTNRAKALFA
jgi:putative chitinase